jgi:hypothetical protein
MMVIKSNGVSFLYLLFLIIFLILEIILDRVGR